MSGVCSGNPKDCFFDVCKTDACDPVTGCINDPISCDDGIGCTADSCDSTLGCSNTPVDAACDDISTCTNDSCVPSVGCVFVDNGTCPICFPVGANCSSGADCCSGKCKGGGKKGKSCKE